MSQCAARTPSSNPRRVAMLYAGGGPYVTTSRFAHPASGKASAISPMLSSLFILVFSFGPSMAIRASLLLYFQNPQSPLPVAQPAPEDRAAAPLKIFPRTVTFCASPANLHVTVALSIPPGIFCGSPAGGTYPEYGENYERYSLPRHGRYPLRSRPDRHTTKRFEKPDRHRIEYVPEQRAGLRHLRAASRHDRNRRQWRSQRQCRRHRHGLQPRRRRELRIAERLDAPAHRRRTSSRPGDSHRLQPGQRCLWTQIGRAHV